MGVRPQTARTPAARRTMSRFLEAAEAIFGRHGYEGTTVRDIAARSGANLGTLKHYWGSKRDLFRDLAERRLEPVRAETAARLSAVDPRNNQGRMPGTAEVVACLVEPAFLVGVQSSPDLDFNDPGARGRFHLFFGRCLNDPSPEILAELNDMFADITRQFFDLMRLASPGVTQAELDWRINCIFGAVSFAQLHGERIGRFVGDEVNVAGEQAARWVMHFLTRGASAPAMRVPAPAEPGGKGKTRNRGVRSPAISRSKHK